jgi:hypothetical protein
MLAVSVTSISQYLQFVVAVPGKAVQFGGKCWITTGCIDLPSITEILARELQPEPSIGAGD